MTNDESSLTIVCDTHGESQYCILCQHLREGADLGYYAIAEEPGEPAQAWCEDCDQALQADRGWSDRADQIAGWALYCASCYEEALEQHHLLSWVEGSSPDD